MSYRYHAAAFGALLTASPLVAQQGRSILIGLSFPAPAMAASQGATVTGAVKLVGKPTPNPAIDMSEEPSCKAKYTTAPLDEIVAVNPNGTLDNVFVYVTSGLPAGVNYPTPTTAVVLDQTGYMFTSRASSGSWSASHSRSRTAIRCCTTSRRSERRIGGSTSASQA